MPEILKKMLLEKGYDFYIEQYTNPGVQLWSHFKNALPKDENSEDSLNKIRFTKAEKLILQNNWDFIIIQGGTVPMLIPGVIDEKLSKSFMNLKSLNKNEKIILFETWPSLREYPKKYCYSLKNFSPNKSCSIQINNLEEEVEVIKASYVKMAHKYSFHLSNTCNKFYRILKNHKDISLYEDDIHPNEYGAFLNACIFYKMITKEKSIHVKYNGSIEKEKAQLLKKIADL